MNRCARLFTTLAGFLIPLACAAECAPPPVRNASHAVCYAVAYADQNGLPHRPPLKTRVTKGAKVWTVRVANPRTDAKVHGWEADVDGASGKVVRFRGYK